jgi:hypothetical protein
MATKITTTQDKLLTRVGSLEQIVAELGDITKIELNSNKNGLVITKGDGTTEEVDLSSLENTITLSGSNTTAAIYNKLATFKYSVIFNNKTYIPYSKATNPEGLQFLSVPQVVAMGSVAVYSSILMVYGSERSYSFITEDHTNKLATSASVDLKQDQTISVEGISATTVVGALSEIKSIADSGGTGVSELQTKVSAIETKNTEQDSAIASAQSKADDAYNLAQGRSKGVAFDSVAQMTTSLKAASSTEYRVGDEIYIKAEGTPDYWVSSVLSTNAGTYGYYELTELEGKIDLTPYQTKNLSSAVGTMGTVETALRNNFELINTHRQAKDNPHGVTKSQVGLSNVVNTGDSATPVSGGTTKFTTGGAYTELNKKVDKVSGKGLSTNDLTNELKSSYDSAAANSHTHSNKSTLDAITSDVKSGYDSAVTKVNNFTGGIVTISSGALSETMTLSSTELTNIKNAIRHATSNTQFVSNIRFNFVTGTNVSIDFSISDYSASNTHYLLLTGHYIDTSKIYKVYLGFTYANDTLTHNAIRIEEYGTF